MRSLTVYLYDEATGETRGTYDAQESPLEQGSFITPVHSTQKPVPPLGVGETALFKNDNWVVVPIPQDPATPPHVLTLDEEKNDAVSAINQACAADIVAGFESSALGQAHHYTSTLEDQANLSGLVLIGLDDEFACSDGAGVKAMRMHTIDQLKQVLADGATAKKIHLVRARQMKAAISAIQETDPDPIAAVRAIVW